MHLFKQDSQRYISIATNSSTSTRHAGQNLLWCHKFILRYGFCWKKSDSLCGPITPELRSKLDMNYIYSLSMSEERREALEILEVTNRFHIYVNV